MEASVEILVWQVMHVATIAAMSGVALAAVLKAAKSDACCGLRWAAACDFVLSDWRFLTLGMIVQPLAGFGLAGAEGVSAGMPLLASAWLLWVLGSACWAPVVWLQFRLRGMAELALGEHAALPPSYWQGFGAYCAFGWPAVVANLACAAMMAVGLEM